MKIEWDANMASFEVLSRKIESKPKLVTITVYYRTAHLREIYRKSLESLLRLAVNGHAIYLVVNGSPDDTYSFVKRTIKEYMKTLNRYSKSVIIIKSNRNLGFSRATLLAYELMKRIQRPKYVALVNDDFMPKSSSLNVLLSILEKHDWIAGISGIVLGLDERIQSYQYLLCNEYPIPMLSLHDSLKPSFPTWLTGSFSIYRFQSLEACGGVFENAPFMYGDDVELGIRLWRCGQKILTIPLVVGHHYGGASTSNGGHKPNRFYEYSMYDALGRITIGRYPCLASLRFPIIFTYILRSVMYGITGRYEGFLKSLIAVKGAYSEPKKTVSNLREPRLCDLACTFVRRPLSLITKSWRRGGCK